MFHEPGTLSIVLGQYFVASIHLAIQVIYNKSIIWSIMVSSASFQAINTRQESVSNDLYHYSPNTYRVLRYVLRKVHHLQKHSELPQQSVYSIALPSPYVILRSRSGLHSSMLPSPASAIVCSKSYSTASVSPLLKKNSRKNEEGQQETYRQDSFHNIPGTFFTTDRQPINIRSPYQHSLRA